MAKGRAKELLLTDSVMFMKSYCISDFLCLTKLTVPNPYHTSLLDQPKNHRASVSLCLILINTFFSFAPPILPDFSNLDRAVLERNYTFDRMGSHVQVLDPSPYCKADRELD